MAARPTPLKKCKEGSKLFYCTDLLGKLHRRIVRLLKSFLNFQNSWFLLIIGIRSYGRQLFVIVAECLFITLIITIAKQTKKNEKFLPSLLQIMEGLYKWYV